MRTRVVHCCQHCTLERVWRFGCAWLASGAPTMTQKQAGHVRATCPCTVRQGRHPQQALLIGVQHLVSTADGALCTSYCS